MTQLCRSIDGNDRLNEWMNEWSLQCYEQLIMVVMKRILSTFVWCAINKYQQTLHHLTYIYTYTHIHIYTYTSLTYMVQVTTLTMSINMIGLPVTNSPFDSLFAKKASIRFHWLVIYVSRSLRGNLPNKNAKYWPMISIVWSTIILTPLIGSYKMMDGYGQWLVWSGI